MPALDNVVGFPSRMADSFRNFLAGFGTWKDKSMQQSPHLRLLQVNELEALYRSDWVSRKICDLPAFDSTREWRTWQAASDQVLKLEEQERLLGLQRKLLFGISRARLWGGSALIMGIEGAGDFNEELNLDKVKRGSLKFVHAIERWMIQAGPRVRDITSPYFGEPNYYIRSNIPVIDPPGNVTPVPQSSLGYQPGDVLYIHPSRVCRLVGLEYPDIERSPDAWGDSCLQPVYDAIKDANLVSSAISSMIAEAKLDIIKVSGLAETLSTTAGTNKLISRFANANAAKSVINSLLLDKDGEEFDRRELHFAGMDKVMQMYLLIAAGAADIPATRLLGREPAGQNATGESDIRNYYDRLSSEQKVHLTPTMSRLDEVLIRHTFGSRDPEITYTWNPLWQMSAPEAAGVILQKAQAFAIDVNSGLIDPMVLGKGRLNQLVEDDVYPGLKGIIEENEELEESLQDPDETAQKQLEMQMQLQKAKGQGNPGGAKEESNIENEQSDTVSDAQKMTLCIKRDLLNIADIKKWARSQGLRSILVDPHVTVLYSKEPVDWMKAGRSSKKVEVDEGEPRVMSKFGPGALVLEFASPELRYRHERLVLALGASHDYDEYNPHVTITYDYDGDSADIEPYIGPLQFGPERFKQISPDNPHESREVVLRKAA